MRYRHLVMLALLLAACVPATRARMQVDADVSSRVRVLRTRRLLEVTPHRVVDTVVVSLPPDAGEWSTAAALRLAAAERGANAVLVLDTLRGGERTRVRALAVRLDESPVDAALVDPSTARDTMDALAWRRVAALRHDAWNRRGEREALRHVVALRPCDAAAWHALALVTSDESERWAAWRRAATLDSVYLAPRLSLGTQLATERAHATEALRWLDDAARLGARGEAYYWRGRALLQLERWTEAHDAFVASADAGGFDFSWGWAGAAYALSRAGRHAEAVAMWDRVLALQPTWFNRVARQAGMIRDERSAWERSREALGRG